MIEITDLYKEFEGTPVLRGISLNIEKDQFLALIGLSGSGKSVLLKHLAGLMKPDRGTIRIDGRELLRLRGAGLRELRARFGFVFQNGALFDSMTVFENVAFPLKEKTKLSRQDLRNRVMDELEQVGLMGAENKYPAEISGGMVKRAALARALVTQPEILFFDEPTTGLDPIIANSMLELFGKCHERLGLAGVIVSHDIPQVFRIVQKVAMLHEGRLRLVGTPEEIQSSADPVVRQFLSGSTSGPIQYR